MQKGQPNPRSSFDDHNGANHLYRQETPASYAQGFTDGFEAGRRSCLGEGTNTHRAVGPNGQRYSAGGTTSHSPMPSQNTRGIVGARETRTKTFSHPTNRDIPSHIDRTNHPEHHPTTANPRRLSGGFQPRQSLDAQMRTRTDQATMPTTVTNTTSPHDTRPHNREHEMSGRVSTPDTPVQFSARGHY